MALIGTGEAGESWPPPSSERGPGVKRYDVEINGIKTTLLLSDADAKARGLKPPAETKQAEAPKNKTRTAPGKQG
jgi:hypothetical protein